MRPNKNPEIYWASDQIGKRKLPIDYPVTLPGELLIYIKPTNAKPLPKCERCRGSGYIILNQIDQDPSEGHRIPCGCLYPRYSSFTAVVNLAFDDVVDESEGGFTKDQAYLIKKAVMMRKWDRIYVVGGSGWGRAPAIAHALRRYFHDGSEWEMASDTLNKYVFKLLLDVMFEDLDDGLGDL